MSCSDSKARATFNSVHQCFIYEQREDRISRRDEGKGSKWNERGEGGEDGAGGHSGAGVIWLGPETVQTQSFNEYNQEEGEAILASQLRNFK